MLQFYDAPDGPVFVAASLGYPVSQLYASK
jgi:hypothetical protein